ncbi:MAG: J domain-containing protein [Rhodospirillales bacterium]|nr:J domain-containing protein [Rhodospirillales bacterium]
MPGCPAAGDFKAPKDRLLNEYYHFCLEHVQEYNRAWNFFSGMAQCDIEDHIVSSMTGERPTWRYDGFAGLEENLYRRAWQNYHYTEKDPGQDKAEATGPAYTTPEYDAMAIMGLEPPLTLDRIKLRYRTLAKQHHPDLNKNNPESEELLKRINMAYTILKLAYEKFEDLPERS